MKESMKIRRIICSLMCCCSGVTALWIGAVRAEAPLSHRTDLTEDQRSRVAAVLDAPIDFSKAERFEARPGGATTNMTVLSGDAFSQASANISFEDQQTFKLGNGLFKKLWVSSPSSTHASDGLGPLFNARSCQRCHLKDGRGHPPANVEDQTTSLFMRISIPPQTDAQKEALKNTTQLVIPEPNYGTQIQDFAVPGVPAEARVKITYEEQSVTLADGTKVNLRKPTYALDNLGYGPLHPEAMLSPRIAPQMIGLGLLEAIHPGDIQMLADPMDQDGDGISGRMHIIKDASGTRVLGRFGHKATTATVREQSADAFAGDIGISSPLAPRHWGDCTPAQTDCLRAAPGVQPRLGDTEAPDPVLELVTFYASNLAVPKRRDVSDATALRGKRVFHNSGCAACHTPKFVTRRDTTDKAMAFQLIWPYTDLLLHDMGPGLADHRPVGSASGQEWRTAPLWGIGLTPVVNGHSFYLHDGRARSLLEAILWHGGEAEAAREAVIRLSTMDREALLKFVESL